jgi:hypothetical protein
MMLALAAKKCGVSENRHAVAQGEKRPLVQPAAWIRRRIYRSPLGPLIADAEYRCSRNRDNDGCLSTLLGNIAHAPVNCRCQCAAEPRI